MKRGEFIKKGLGCTLGAAAGIGQLASATLTVYGVEHHSDMGSGKPVDIPEDTPNEPTPPKPPASNAYIFDTELSGEQFKIHGVNHTENFARRDLSSLSDLVSQSKYVVMEGTPVELSSGRTPGDRNSYFGTIAELCKTHSKSLVMLDSQGFAPWSLEMALGYLAAIPTALGIRNIIAGDDGVNTVGSTVKGATQLGIGSALFNGSLFNSLIAKGLLDYAIDGKAGQVTTGRGPFTDLSLLGYGHTEDQRTIQMLKRLRRLPNLVQNKSEGEFVLATFGALHVQNMEWYHNHPVALVLKDSSYNLSYDLIDSNEISEYTHDGSKWNQQRLD